MCLIENALPEIGADLLHLGGGLDLLHHQVYGIVLCLTVRVEGHRGKQFQLD